MSRRVLAWTLMGFLFGAFVAPAEAQRPGESPRSGASRRSDFWAEVRQPGTRAYREAVERADRALRARSFNRAAQLAKGAAEGLPERPDAYVIQGLALGELGQPEASAEALERALALAPSSLDDPYYGARAAAFLARAGHHERAAELLGRLLGRMADGPNRQNLYVLYGDVLSVLGPERLSDAERAYREALRAVAHHPRAVIGLALVLHRQNGDEAEWRQLGELVASRGRLDELLRSLPIPEHERAARKAVALTAIGDRRGARSAWDLAREGPWAEHATRASEALR